MNGIYNHVIDLKPEDYLKKVVKKGRKKPGPALQKILKRWGRLLGLNRFNIG